MEVVLVALVAEELSVDGKKRGVAQSIARSLSCGAGEHDGRVLSQVDAFDVAVPAVERRLAAGGRRGRCPGVDRLAVGAERVGNHAAIVGDGGLEVRVRLVKVAKSHCELDVLARPRRRARAPIAVGAELGTDAADALAGSLGPFFVARRRHLELGASATADEPHGQHRRHEPRHHHRHHG